MELVKEQIKNNIDSPSIDNLTFTDFVSFFRAEQAMKPFVPEKETRTDPRTGIPILYNTSRASRPEDFSTVKTPAAKKSNDCVICQGKTTRLLDMADLSQGFTFINKNLFPIAYPEQGAGSYGLHFLHWASSVHENDWYNMPREDCYKSMSRLIKLESRLLNSGTTKGHVSIIKNYGLLVGGSLAHGHQQIIYSNEMPRHFSLDIEFEKNHGEAFPGWLLRENSSSLTIKDYGCARLVVPFFMSRPFDMMFLLNDTSKKHLYELNREETEALTASWQDATRLIHEIMPRTGRQLAFNITCHNGPSAGIYTEFLPYTQEMGGFEKLGLYCCQRSPQDAADILKEII